MTSPGFKRELAAQLSNLLFVESGSTKSTAKINLMRQMHAFIGPSEAPQHITLTNDEDAANGFKTRQLFTVTESKSKLKKRIFTEIQTCPFRTNSMCAKDGT